MILDDLYNAIEVRKKYNAMKFKDFAKLVEKRLNKKFSKKKISDWKFIGLNNVDFLDFVDVGENIYTEVKSNVTR